MLTTETKVTTVTMVIMSVNTSVETKVTMVTKVPRLEC
jgi:hypothetical protein